MNRFISKISLWGVLSTSAVCVLSCTEKKGPDILHISDQIIYSNDFDKETSSETYGDKGKSWPYLEQFDGWQNEQGIGSEGVSYESQKISVRSNQSSQGNLSLYEGSGQNNLFFSKAPNFFVIKDIAVGTRNLQLSFGAQRYAQGASNEFLKSDFEVRVSMDNETWSQPLVYEFNEKDQAGQWRLASLDFTLPQKSPRLSIKFVAKMSSTNRIDDICLKEGYGGQKVVSGGDESVPVSCIQQVIEGATDHIYRVKGQIVGTHDKGFLLKDESGIILVFKKKHGMKVGSIVEIQGATTSYGGMKQFGETTEILTAIEGSCTQPEPEVFLAADLEAYMKSPAIRYIVYEGVMTSYRDNIWQWHNNVSIDGTDVIGALMYPPHDINIQQYENQKIRVTGYAIGAKTTADDVRLVNTMVDHIDKVL